MTKVCENKVFVDEFWGDLAGEYSKGLGGFPKDWMLPCNISRTLVIDGRSDGLV